MLCTLQSTASKLLPRRPMPVAPYAAGAEGDLQLAWENLETAKVIWAKDADNHAQQLAGRAGQAADGGLAVQSAFAIWQALATAVVTLLLPSHYCSQQSGCGHGSAAPLSCTTL